MKQIHPRSAPAGRRYRSLARQLAGIGLISQGSVQDRTHRQGQNGSIKIKAKGSSKVVFDKPGGGG